MAAQPTNKFNKRIAPPSYLLQARKRAWERDRALIIATASTLREAQATYDHARTVALLLDSAGSLIGVRKPGELDVGLDPILSLVPLAGDFIGLILGLYILLLAFMLGADLPLLGRMLANLAIDACAGFIPVAGPLIDAAFQANVLNVSLLEKHLRSSKWAAITLPPPRSWFPQFGRRAGPSGTATM